MGKNLDYFRAETFGEELTKSELTQKIECYRLGMEARNALLQDLIKQQEQMAERIKRLEQTLQRK